MKFLFVDIQTLIENELAGSNRSTLTHDKNASGGNGLFAIEADNIDIDARWKDNLLAIVQAPNDVQAALDTGGALKIERLGGLRHLECQLVDDVLAMARQKTFDTFDILGIIRRRNRADACARATTDMIVKTGASVLRANHIDDVFFALMRFDDAAAATPLRTGC